MRNKFKYSKTNKRYHTLDYFYKEKFNSKVFKVSLNANFSCPNKDGCVGFCGCIYCSDGSGNPLYEDQDLITQFNKVKKTMEKKWPNSKYIAYFQTGTNTYAPLEELKEKYEAVLKLDKVVGLNIATRCDSITPEVLDYLEDLSKRTYLTVELGLQTTNEKTALLINRCHDLKTFDDMVKKLKARNIPVVVHIINGLPYETKEDMLKTVRHLNNLNIDGLKIHMLFIEKKTALEELYLKKKFKILSKEEYVDIVVNQLELLKPEIVIHRLTGDAIKEKLIEPEWSIKKVSVLNDIDKSMAKRDTYQGDNL